MPKRAQLLLFLFVFFAVMTLLEFQSAATEAQMSAADVQDLTIALSLGLLSAAGSTLWGFIDSNLRPNSSEPRLWVNMAAGLFVGLFGGLFAFEWAENHYHTLYSRAALAMMVSGAISLFGVPFLRLVYQAGVKYMSAKTTTNAPPDSGDKNKD